MSYSAHRKDFGPYLDATSTTPPTASPVKRGLMRRFFDSVIHSRQRQAEREIAQHLARSGGRLTDSLEREMMQSLTTTSWGMRL